MSIRNFLREGNEFSRGQDTKEYRKKREAIRMKALADLEKQKKRAAEAQRRRQTATPEGPGPDPEVSHTEYEGPSLAEKLRYIKEEYPGSDPKKDWDKAFIKLHVKRGESSSKKHIAGSKKKLGTTPKKKLVKTTKGKPDVFGQMGLPKLPGLPSVRK